MKKKFLFLWRILVLIVARAISIFIRDKNIWLVMEKKTEARDNGYWFFKYLRENHPDYNVWYVITDDSPDRHKVEKIGKLIKADSFKHCVYYWAARYNICSQAFGAYPFTYVNDVRYIQRLKWKQSKIVFLQHGVIKDELPHIIDADRSNIDYIVASSERERQAIMQVHKYPRERVLLTGLCRFDNLMSKHSKSNQILIMPTFRNWLVGKSETIAPDEEDTKKFKEDAFYKEYYNLLSSQRLQDLLEKYNFKVVFYPHYSVQRYLPLFADINRTERVIVASREEYDVQDLLIESDVLITDYSSVFFDFAYMKKPEIFFQFDEKRYRSSHYKEGYFSYSKDGFGLVVHNVDELLDCVEKILTDKCKMEPHYIERVDNFFSFTDQCNCERVYHAIVES